MRVERAPIMPKQAPLTRKSFFIDTVALRRAKRVLRVRTDAEAVRLSLERVAEMDRFWRFMVKSRATLRAGNIEAP
jgi:hypothetical protein